MTTFPVDVSTFIVAKKPFSAVKKLRGSGREVGLPDRAGINSINISNFN